MKKIIVVGIGITGIGIIDFFKDKEDYEILVYDEKKDFGDKLKKYEGYKNIKFNLGFNPRGDEDVESVYLSPAVPLDVDFVQKFIKNKVRVTNEIELSYENLNKGHIIGITGTNGKTTTTMLTGKIYNSYYGNKSFVAGNIGKSVIGDIISSNGDSYYVTELSSFQLESIDKFRPHIATILNISEDHMNRHKTIENYKKAKYNIFKNQKEEDFLIINKDDKNIDIDINTLRPKLYYFSINKIEEDGIYYDQNDGYIYINDIGKNIKVMDISKIHLIGKHNIKNVMASIMISYLDKIPMDKIIESVENFKSPDYRMQKIAKIKGVEYINDSKATNPDSTRVALESFDKNVILIAGGYDKKSEYDDIVKMFKGRVKALLLFGQTRSDIAKVCDAYDYIDYIILPDLQTCVRFASKISLKGDIVLFSPFCASFDMYENFEKRGEHFTKLIQELKMG